MRVYYDLHVHSCLSPCADDDMTPNNIVNMALLLGYDMIAVTDHNSCRNIPAVAQAGEANGLTVVPGMELCTAEEVHVICLFPTVEAALGFDRFVWERMPQIKNRPEIFGNQTVMDEDDTVTGKEDILLLNASSIGIDTIQKTVHRFGGTSFPAHIDRSAYSVLANLGGIPPEAGFAAAEISAKTNAPALLEQNRELADMTLLFNSDAHTLESMPDRCASIVLQEKSPQCLISTLEGKIRGTWF